MALPISNHYCSLHEVAAYRGSDRQGHLVELEVVAGVAVADVFDQLAEQGRLVRQGAAGDVVAEQVAEQAAEVLVTGVAEEAAAVGEHADKAR